MPITSEMKTAAKTVRKAFKYESDGKIDDWDIPQSGSKIEDDCEGFALATLYQLKGQYRKSTIKALMDKEARIYRVKTSSGRGHAVLEYNGCFIDNRYPVWTESWRPEYKSRKAYSRGMILLKLSFGKLV